MKTIYIISDDKIGRIAMNALGQDKVIFRNQAVGSMRVLKLIRKNAVEFRDIVKMALADLARENQDISDFPIVKTNNDLLRYIAAEKPERVVCYRAGLVLNQQVLGLGPQFLNIHCADLPAFGGLGSIPRAIRSGVLDQNACLHEMSLEIDGGRVLYKEPYQLLDANTYRENEDLAYAAGRKILLRIANDEVQL